MGWLYVLSALAAGLWLTTLVLPERMLRGLTASRQVNGSDSGADLELCAGQPVTVQLTLHNHSRLPALLLRGWERCPLAPASDQEQVLYIPAIRGHAESSLTIETLCARRGWFTFAPPRLETGAPFGLSRAGRWLTTSGPDGVLVFPAYRELERLDLFDRWPAAETSAARAGAAGEFVGVREYRPGDSRRAIHWRSTARAGRLIAKELAEETQPALCLALDLRRASALGPDGATFERGIQVAATLARYAARQNLPFSLVSNSRDWPAPRGPLSWWGLMSYLARVEPAGTDPFDECLRQLPPGTLAAAILPAPDRDLLAPLADLRRTGSSVLAVIMDPAAWVAGEAGHAAGVEARRLAAELEAAGVAVRLVGAEPDWERALAT